MTVRTTLYLVRHAHAEWSTDEGRPLSSSGREAALAVAARLADLPVSAIYSSTSLRALETVLPLADRLGIRPRLEHDLRERALPEVPADQFVRAVETTWRDPERATAGGEANAAAQARGLAVLGAILEHHRGDHIVVATHGTLLALMLNGLVPGYGFEFWRTTTFPDIYRLEFEAGRLVGVERMWDASA